MYKQIGPILLLVDLMLLLFLFLPNASHKQRIKINITSHRSRKISFWTGSKLFFLSFLFIKEIHIKLILIFYFFVFFVKTENWKKSRCNINIAIKIVKLIFNSRKIYYVLVVGFNIYFCCGIIKNKKSKHVCLREREKTSKYQFIWIIEVMWNS